MSRGNGFAGAAHGYASRGLAVFPLMPNGKIPLIAKADGGNGCLDASLDVAQIETWWGRARDANVGLATGKVSGVWVLDIDVDKGGDRSIAELEHHHGALPSTWSVRTGSGGRHLYWSLPDVALRNRAGLWPGIDTRADGGYVVAPPSVHPNGTLYEWEQAPSLDPPTAAPDWLVRAVTSEKTSPRPAAPVDFSSIPTSRRVDNAIRYLAKMPASVSGHGGHQALWAATVTLIVGFALPPDAALGILHRDFNPRCKPAWSEKELRHKVDDAQKARLSAGYLLERDGVTSHATSQVSIAPETFFLGKMFMEHGWLGQQVRPGVWAAMCPTRTLHTTGEDMDSTTMLFAPNGPGRPGFFKCAHAECDGIYRDCGDVVNALLREERCPV